MTLQELRWILQLQNHMNFTRAAEALYITQPSLSQCVQRVEVELGFPIFERSHRQISLTEPGKRFLAAAGELVRNFDASVQEIQAEYGAQHTRIVIGLTPYVSSLISHRLSQIRDQFPGTEIRFYESNTMDLVEQFRQGKVQLLCTNMPIQDPGCQSLVWGTHRFMVILREGSPLGKYAVDTGRSYPELDPCYLKKEPMAISAEGSYSRVRTMEILAQAGVTPKVVQNASRPTTLCTLARNGVASSLFHVSAEVRDGLKDTNCLYHIPAKYTSATGNQYLVYHKKDTRRFPEGFLDVMLSQMRRIADRLLTD